MSKTTLYRGISRRAFVKTSGGMLATLAGLPQLPKAQVMSPDLIKPFAIAVPEATLKDLRDRLARTRFPDQLDQAGWQYGTELSYLRELCAYWRSSFDWRAQERKLNRLPQFQTRIGGLNMHFLHQQSKERDAIPLILVHGWPGSFWEFTKIIGPLTNPRAHGGRAEDAFHVICPSLPGYGFSEVPGKPGFGCKQAAEILVSLMARLGYAQYGAHGGDWGSYISTWMAALDAPHVKGLHLSATVANPLEPSVDAGENMPREAKRGMEEEMLLMHLEGGYVAIQSTKPQTLGYALNDSPAGLAAWIVEKFRNWSDCGGNVEKRFTKDELLTNIMIYWTTQTIASSMRLYYEARASKWILLPAKKGTVPTGFALSPLEPQVPRKQVEKHLHVTHWNVLPSGGHFLSLEEPDLLVEGSLAVEDGGLAVLVPRERLLEGGPDGGVGLVDLRPLDGSQRHVEVDAEGQDDQAQERVVEQVIVRRVVLILCEGGEKNGHGIIL